jgi:hypothetical protein
VDVWVQWLILDCAALHRYRSTEALEARKRAGTAASDRGSGCSAAGDGW